jgi:hypothetical protein
VIISTRQLGSARVLYGVTGIFLVTPIEAFAAARWVNMAGVLLAVALFASDRLMRRRPAVA